MVKSNLPNNSLTNDNLTAEAIHLTTLYNTKPRSSSGQVSFISSTSGVTYTTLGSAYDNQGQEGLLQVLQLALDNYLIVADDYNSIIDDISTHIGTDASDTVKGHVELATALETTTGTDATRVVTPLGLKSATNLLIPLSQKGVANGVATLDASGKVVQTASVFLPEYNSGSIDLSNIPTNQIWKLSNYTTNNFQMKIGSTKYYVDLLSMLTAYPSSGFFAYIGDLYYANTFPKGYAPTLGAPYSGCINTLALNADRMTMFVSVPSTGGAASVKVSFGNYDISLVSRIDVTMRVVSTSNMNSGSLKINCIPVLSTNTMGVATSNYSNATVGASYVTISYDVSAFLGIAEIYLLLSVAYSSSGGTYSITMDVSRVTLVTM